MTHAKKTSRRHFLGSSAAAAAGAIAVPTIISSGVLAAPGRAGANDRIGVGYIGCGRRHGGLRNLPKDAQVVAAADCCLPRARATAGQAGKAFQDYRRLLELKDVHAVIVASPDHWHALHSIHACQAGKDVYVEKPMTLTIREGRLMVQAARKHGRIVQVGSQQRSMKANREGCERVLNGAVGKLHTVLGNNYPSPWECKLPAQPVPDGLDWDLWCGPTEPVPFHKDIFTPRASPGWISFRPWSGGEMTGWGAHGLDQVQWALDMDNSGPVEVWVEGPKFAPPTFTEPGPRRKGESVCNKPTVSYRYASGVVLKLEGGPLGGAVFIGDKGKVRIDRGKWSADPKDLATDPLPADAQRLYVSDNHMGNWFDCMKSRKLPAADVEIGHRSTTVGNLGNIARWLGRKLQWDPAKETFPGDDEANTYLDRPRRKGYEMPEKV